MKFYDLGEELGVAGPGGSPSKRYFPSVSIAGPETEILKGKKVGDEIVFVVKAKVRSQAEDESGTRYSVDLQQIAREEEEDDDKHESARPPTSMEEAAFQAAREAS